MKKPSSICIFGDSTAWGAWDTDKGGWANRLWLEVSKRAEENYVEVYNCSISGGTTETILARFEAEAKIRNADAIIFQTGGNDSAYEHTPDNYLVIEDKFRENLLEIIKRAKKITDKIIFTDLKNCDETKTTPVSWIDIYYTNKNISRYLEIMMEVCKEDDVLFMDTEELENKDFEDGLHPNINGHIKIFNQVKKFLIENSWI